MGPGEAIAFLAAVAGMAGTTITLAVTWMRHRERMAGLRGKGVDRLGETVQLLTETLEKQHDKQQVLERRLAVIERGSSAPALDAVPAPALSLPEDDEALPLRSPATEPVRARVPA